MTIQRSDIEKLAELAQIQISEDSIASTLERLTEVIKLVDQLEAVDTTGIVPMAHPLDAVQRLRPDVVTADNQREALQAIAPAVADGLYLVPRVIE